MLSFRLHASLRSRLLAAVAGCFLVSCATNAAELACDACFSCDGGFADLPCGCCDVPIETQRDSFCQGLEALGGYLGDLGDAAGGLDQSYEEVRASFGMPLGSMDNILGFRPYFRADHLEGPTAFDVPATLYDTGVTVLHQMKWSESLSSTLVLSPGIRSDFRTGDDAFRMFGLALINWQPYCDLTLSAGVVYFDRNDVPLLPAIGASWTPSPRWRVDATMPRPRIAHRLWKDCNRAEGWAYLAGTLGGNTWAVRRDSGVSDELSIRDFRVLFGYEVIRHGNRGFHIEGGYVFGRTIEYESQVGDTDLDDALIAQAGWKF